MPAEARRRRRGLGQLGRRRARGGRRPQPYRSDDADDGKLCANDSLSRHDRGIGIPRRVADRYICRVDRVALVIGSRQLERVAVMTHLKPVAVLLALLATAGLHAAAPDHRVADAVEQRNATAVASLLKQGADANGAQPDGATALHWAAHWDDLADRRVAAQGQAHAPIRSMTMASARWPWPARTAASASSSACSRPAPIPTPRRPPG